MISCMLEHLAPTCSAEDVVTALKRDGAVIIDDVLTADELSVLQEQLAPCLAATAPGQDDFTGRNTRRFGSLIERVPASRRLVMDSLINEATKLFLDGSTAYQLHLTQAICIGPDSPAQGIHRDEWAFDFFEFPRGFEVQCNTIWAITDFTEANGATRVVPGSQYETGAVAYTDEDSVPAEMRAGSIVVYSGCVYHGGGANTTSDQTRIGLNITYNRGWLRQEENQYLAVSRECAATLDEPLLRLMGYQKGAFALGYIDDLRDPISVINPEFANAYGFAT
jgi:hypothetical protein